MCIRDRGIVRHPGAFAEFFTLPERNLHVLPDDVPTDRAVFLEPLAAACEILDQVAIPAGEHVAVLGDGKLGLLVAMVLNAHGYRVHQFGCHAAKLAISARTGVQMCIRDSTVSLPNFGGKLLVLNFWATWCPPCVQETPSLSQFAATYAPKGVVVLGISVDRDRCV